ncbi:hypothetical protein COU91_00760 [Candidatus Saccharibacteria bacterium CG10_big_fil_rev_8_21_14_0_10_47_8]|nr:MAG: hypothetical protein COU91_00760 [Candidatus Saccharibacteria bacterium CG10_big_fil_rev_8_21_14_0_10_47_8]
MNTWFGNNLKKIQNSLLMFAPLKNKKLKFGKIAGLATALFGVFVWQTVGAVNAPATGLLPPAQTDNQALLEVQSNTPAPLDAAVPTTGAVNSSSADINVNVNGQDVAIPSEGSVHKVINDGNGTTTIDVNVQNNSSGSSNNRSYVHSNLNINSSSNTSVRQGVDQDFWGGDM